MGNDVLLINSPIILYKDKADKLRFKDHGGDETSYYPLNILYLASYLESKGHSVKVMDISAQGLNLWEVISLAITQNPRIIGISAMTTGIQSAITLAKSLKEYLPETVIGLGGVHITSDPTFIDRYPFFDFCVIGEGEITLEKIVSKVKKGEKIDRVNIGEQVEDLDSLPFPARHLIDYSIYKRKEQLKFEVPAAGILASRGCPFDCIFCAIPARGKKVRYRSAKNIVDEMEVVYGQCNGQYSFVDDCFTASYSRTKELCEEIIRRGLRCRWIASTRADRLTPELGELLRRAGCRELYFGVESGSDKIRNEVVGKHLSEESIKKAVKICKESKIISNLFLMVGFPRETKQDLNETIRIGNRVGADAIGVHITMPMPGSKIYSMANVDLDGYINGARGFRGIYPLYIPDGLTLKDLENAKKSAYRRFYFNPAWMLRRIRIWLTIKGRFKEDLKLFKLIPQVFLKGQTRGQLS